MLAFLSGLAGTGAVMLVVQSSSAYPTVIMAPRIDEAFKANVFPRSILGSVIIGTDMSC